MTRISSFIAITLVLLSCSQPARAQPAERIVSIGGAVTETLYALGKSQAIVGVDTTSLFPAEALKDKPNVGYMRALSIEGILSLQPTRIIAIEGAGPPDVLKQIEAAGVPLTLVKDEFSAEGSVAKIEQIGAIVGATEAAARLSALTTRRFAEIEARSVKLGKDKRVLFVLSLQNGRVLAGGRGTAADAIIRLAGGSNAAAGFDGYKPMGDEAVIAAAPETVLMMETGNHAASGTDVFALPAFSATPAAGTKALFAFDGLYLLGFGPRTPDAVRDLMLKLHPGETLPPLTPLP